MKKYEYMTVDLSAEPNFQYTTSNFFSIISSVLFKIYDTAVCGSKFAMNGIAVREH